MIIVDQASPVPPYEQLRTQFARQIHDRTLPIGSRLPTVRQLAADLGLATNTVVRAYRELEEAGLIEGRGRAGTYVAITGERARERAGRAAAQYATTALSLGLDTDEALRMVDAALRAARAGRPTSAPTGSASGPS